tara:strand:+ start:517 stop:678 length:162 start_codon:yes stop_codon:yes gene_type:complete
MASSENLSIATPKRRECHKHNNGQHVMPQGVIQSGDGELISEKDDLGSQIPEG